MARLMNYGWHLNVKDLNVKDHAFLVDLMEVKEMHTSWVVWLCYRL